MVIAVIVLAVFNYSESFWLQIPQGLTNAFPGFFNTTDSVRCTARRIISIIDRLGPINTVLIKTCLDNPVLVPLAADLMVIENKLKDVKGAANRILDGQVTVFHLATITKDVKDFTDSLSTLAVHAKMIKANSTVIDDKLLTKTYDLISKLKEAWETNIPELAACVNSPF